MIEEVMTFLAIVCPSMYIWCGSACGTATHHVINILPDKGGPAQERAGYIYQAGEGVEVCGPEKEPVLAIGGVYDASQDQA